MVAIKCVFNDLLTIKFNEQKKIIVNNKKIFFHIRHIKFREIFRDLSSNLLKIQEIQRITFKILSLLKIYQ